ncbi:MAG: hypothetical protein Q9210_007515 [Variospora velana]
MDTKDRDNNWRLTKETFRLSQNLGHGIRFGAKKAILSDFRVYTDAVQLDLLMEEGERAFPVVAFADMINPCRKYKFEGPHEFSTVDETTCHENELEQEEFEEGGSDAETVQLEERFETVDFISYKFSLPSSLLQGSGY